MPERGFDTGFWGDSFVMKLPKDGKLLFAYLWTNSHCNQACLYEIALETIAFETKIDEADLPNLFALLEKKVKWYPDHNLVWVRNFIKRQSKSPKFLAAVAKSLTSIHHDGAVQELLDYNLLRYGIEIPYRYYMDKVSIAPATDTVSVEKEKAKSSFKDGIVDEKLAKIVDSYESNIGIITPAIAERLKDATRHPDGWFQKAVDEACKHNKRNLAYIEKILERWQAEGIEPLPPDKGKGEVEGLKIRE